MTKRIVPAMTVVHPRDEIEKCSECRHLGISDYCSQIKRYIGRPGVIHPDCRLEKVEGGEE